MTDDPYADLVARLTGADPDRLLPVDALRLYDSDQATFPLSAEDAEGVLDVIDEAADAILKLQGEVASQRASAENAWRLYRQEQSRTNAATPSRMGRKKQWAEDMVARFAEGTFDRIAALLQDGEDRTDFVRAAVERELDARDREARRLAKAGKAD